MHRLSFVVLSLAAAALAPVVPACSSNGAAETDGGAADAAAIGPNQLVGQPCNPLLPDPCLQGDPCDSYECDPVQQICVSQPLAGPCGSELTEGGIEFSGDSGAEDVATVGYYTCQTTANCPVITVDDDDVKRTVTFTCVFSATDGCSATGVCVIPPANPYTKPDGADYTACGCDGQSVTYVDTGETAAPVASPVPCPTDSGSSTTADSGLDGASDASLDGSGDSSSDN